MPNILIKTTQIDHVAKLVHVVLVLIANDAGSEIAIRLPEARLYEISGAGEWSNEHLVLAVSEIFAAAAQDVEFMAAA